MEYPKSFTKRNMLKELLHLIISDTLEKIYRPFVSEMMQCIFFEKVCEKFQT